MSPIAVFAFNRPEPLRATIESLRKNPEAAESDLFVFVDGPRRSHPGDAEAVAAVRAYALEIKGFRNVSIMFSDTNKGLGASIIAGVSEVIDRYGTVIVLEDDLTVEPGFLRFMNDALAAFQDNPDVWSICGYTNKVSVPDSYAFDAYFCTRSSSWGWATWADRWHSVDWTFDRWDEWKRLAGKFNAWGGSDCFGMLDACRIGKNSSWAIRFCFNQFLQDKKSLFPTKSLVANNGFDGSGTNCRRWSRFKSERMPDGVTHFRFPSDTAIDAGIRKSAMRYHSLPLRIFSKIMYALT